MSLNLALSLRGIANFPKYSIAHIRLQTARRHNINRTTERFFKQLFDGDQIKETALVRKLDEAINIRIGSRSATCYRAEDADAHHSQRGKFWAYAVDCGECFGE
ncbi:hypothetical protein LBMAG51_10540 [Phycisphaerae bacterium]|nr:hypothetical protein LBMAG51_10540 [Phycisphaerae bacterium]